LVAVGDDRLDQVGGWLPALRYVSPDCSREVTVIRASGAMVVLGEEAK
jgi:hypothetical protein